MKQIKYIVTCALLLLVGSCAKDLESHKRCDSDGSVNFSAGAITRVSSDGLNWEQNDRIGITNNDAATISEYKITDIASGEMKVVSDQDRILLEAEEVDYYAYYPYSLTPIDGVVSVDLSTQTAGVEPLLWAKSAGQTGDQIALQFSHQYARLQFNLTAYGAGTSDLTGATAKLTGAYAKAKFNITTGEYSDKNSADITLSVEVDSDPKTATISAYALPKANVKGEVKLNITVGGKIFKSTISTPAWEAGENYIYNVDVKKKDLYLSNISTSTYPFNSDEWVILDSGSPTAAEFEGLFNALTRIGNDYDRRKITLIFPHLESVPDGALAPRGGKGIRNVQKIELPIAKTIGAEAFSTFTALKRINCPEATTIGAKAYYGSSAVTAVNLPKATTIGAEAFGGCTSIDSLIVGSNGTILTDIVSIDKSWLSTLTRQEVVGIDLTIGNVSTASPAITIDKGRIIIDGEEQVFKTINGTRPTYAIGDLYPTATDPIGVVFSVPTDGTSGKVVMLEKKQGASYDGFKWARINHYGFSWTFPTVNDLQELYAGTCGLQYRKNSEAPDKSPGDIFDGQVVAWFYLVQMPNNTSYTTQRVAFDAILTGAGGDALDLSECWSSDSPQNPWGIEDFKNSFFVKFYNGSCGPYDREAIKTLRLIHTFK